MVQWCWHDFQLAVSFRIINDSGDLNFDLLTLLDQSINVE
jgi:hypothetical protein